MADLQSAALDQTRLRADGAGGVSEDYEKTAHSCMGDMRVGGIYRFVLTIVKGLYVRY